MPLEQLIEAWERATLHELNITGTGLAISAEFSSELPGDLSIREVEVLRLVAQGLTNAQVADRLVISPRTVNAHLRSIYSKLEITSRNQVIRYAIDSQPDYHCSIHADFVSFTSKFLRFSPNLLNRHGE